MLCFLFLHAGGSAVMRGGGFTSHGFYLHLRAGGSALRLGGGSNLHLMVLS